MFPGSRSMLRIVDSLCFLLHPIPGDKCMNFHNVHNLRCIIIDETSVVFLFT